MKLLTGLTSILLAGLSYITGYDLTPDQHNAPSAQVPQLMPISAAQALPEEPICPEDFKMVAGFPLPPAETDVETPKVLEARQIIVIIRRA